jgi:hypothetical protein
LEAQPFASTTLWTHHSTQAVFCHGGARLDTTHNG